MIDVFVHDICAGSDALSFRQAVFNGQFPETLFAFGLPAFTAFPHDPKVIATRALMAFTNVQLLSLADRCVFAARIEGL